MNWKYSLILGTLGRANDRFACYGPARDLEGKFAAAKKVENLSGLELAYPFDFMDISKIKQLMAHYGFSLSSVNVNIKTEEKFHLGALASPDAGIRCEAIDYIKTAMDIAAEWGCDLITVCPLADGFDYPFQADFRNDWRNFLDGIGDAAAYRPGVRVSLEYKQSEPRNHVILPNAGMALAACYQIGLPNVGVTMDMGHALLAHESPAQSAVLLAQAKRLFLVHTNDNYRDWDWDMIPGSVNPWDLVELMFYLNRMEYDGWIVSDMVPFRLDPVSASTAAFKSIDWAQKIVERMGTEKLEQIIKKGDPLEALALLQKIV